MQFSDISLVFCKPFNALLAIIMENLQYWKKSWTMNRKQSLMKMGI